jgi:hypothetical protein
VIAGTIPATSPASAATFYDPVANITWLADANLAAHESFGPPRCESATSEAPTTPSGCIARDGSMDYDTALQFIEMMNTYDNGPDMPAGYLEVSNWNLPVADDKKCLLFNCSLPTNPMGELFYGQFHLLAGTPVVEPPAIEISPFRHLWPSAYWSCQAAKIEDRCEEDGPSPSSIPPAEWGFSFATGLLGTAHLSADHFVTAYYVGCDLPDQARCLAAPTYVLPAIAEKGGPVYVIPGTVTEESTITLTIVSGSVCLSPGYCTNASGVVTAAAGNTNAPGQVSSFIEVQPDLSELQFNYGALLVSIEGVGKRQVFPAVKETGLNSISPPTRFTAAAPTFRELGFPRFSVQDARIRFIVADTYYPDNSGDFALSLQAPSATDGATASASKFSKPLK